MYYTYKSECRMSTPPFTAPKINIFSETTSRVHFPPEKNYLFGINFQYWTYVKMIFGPPLDPWQRLATKGDIFK